jgi:glycosyltransferase involved in cell wall biosynthesis
MTLSSSRSVCVVALSEIVSDPRVLKQVNKCLDMGYDVTVVGYGGTAALPQGVVLKDLRGWKSGGDAHLTRTARVARALREPRRLVRFALRLGIVKGSRWARYGLLLAGRILPVLYMPAYWLTPVALGLRSVVGRVDCEIYIANDLVTLPAVLAAARGRPVVFDAHEYAPHELHLRWKERVLVNPYKRYLTRRYIPRAAAAMTVCESIANLYSEDTGVRPRVVRNVPPYRAARLKTTDPKAIRLVHHGAAIPARYLEVMIDVVRELPESFDLTFMLTEPDTSSRKYVRFLTDRAASVAPGRVHFVPPVPYGRLVETLTEFDIGIFILPADQNTNYRYALPNKLFEFIMAGLAVVVGPSVEMAKVVTTYDCGVVVPDFSAGAAGEVLKNLKAEDIDAKKRNSLVAARELNAGREMDKLAQMLREVLG